MWGPRSSNLMEQSTPYKKKTPHDLELVKPSRIRWGSQQLPHVARCSSRHHVILVMHHWLPLTQTTWQRMSIVQLLYSAQTWALSMNCESKQKENQEERNAGNMPEFLVNRPVVVLVENQKLPSAGTFVQRNCWFFQGKGRRNSWEKERRKQKNDEKEKIKQNFGLISKLNLQIV